MRLRLLVRTRIDEALATGAPSLSAVARMLAMSARTLQRRLSEEGLRFTDLVDDARRSTSLKLIDDRRFSIHEIAALVGYVDAESFRAAFVRWTGMNPRDYRKQGPTSSPPPGEGQPAGRRRVHATSHAIEVKEDGKKEKQGSA
jgi:AraC-like DNA-binding protein